MWMIGCTIRPRWLVMTGVLVLLAVAALGFVAGADLILRKAYGVTSWDVIKGTTPWLS